MSTTSNSLSDFDRRSSSPSQALTSIKQQPLSPPPYHTFNNGFFANAQQQSTHYHHHSSREHSTPSPGNEQISPRSTHLGESSSTNAVSGATGGQGQFVSAELCPFPFSFKRKMRVRLFPLRFSGSQGRHTRSPQLIAFSLSFVEDSRWSSESSP